MDRKNLRSQPYGDFVVSNSDYVPEWDGMVAGIAFDRFGMHLTTVDPTPEASYELLLWSNINAKGLINIPERCDDLLRWMDEIVIDTDSSGLKRQLPLQQEIMLAISDLQANRRVHRGRANAVNRQLDGKQRSIAAAQYGFEQKQRSLRLLFRKSCQQLESAEDGGGTP